MSRARLERAVDVARPAADVWDYVTDWPRQGEWIPQTVVERVDSADGVGGRFRAWSGLGGPSRRASTAEGLSLWPPGFWDPMTITAWERTPDGGGRCEVLHLGQVVRGEGEFIVLATGATTSRFVLAETVVLPLGLLGRLGWRGARPVLASLADRALRRMRDNLERG